MKEKLNRRRRIALGAGAVIFTVAAATGLAAFKYNETEAQIRRATVEASINPYLITEGAKTINFDPSEIAREQEILKRHAFDPLPPGQIQDHKESAKETRRRINAAISFMEESQNPIFQSTAAFLKKHADSDVVVTPVDSVPANKSPMYTSAAVTENGLGYGIFVSRSDSLYNLNTVGMALELTRQAEGIKHNMEHLITTRENVVNLADEEVAYLDNERNMSERQIRENAIVTEALLYQTALGYTGPIHADIQTDATRFLDSYGNLFVK